MGQYYKIIFLESSQPSPQESSQDTSHETSLPTPPFNIQAFINIRYPWGMKLTEHAYLNNQFMKAIEFLLCPQGPFHKSHIVWAGDYSDSEPFNTIPSLSSEQNQELAENNLNKKNCKKNLYDLTALQPEKEYFFDTPTILSFSTYEALSNSTLKYIVNHSKKLYVNIHKISGDLALHPLALLTAEGNGRGGGDYYGINENLCGCWARDNISLENLPPCSDYEEKWQTPLFE